MNLNKETNIKLRDNDGNFGGVIEITRKLASGQVRRSQYHTRRVGDASVQRLMDILELDGWATFLELSDLEVYEAELSFTPTTQINRPECLTDDLPNDLHALITQMAKARQWQSEAKQVYDAAYARFVAENSGIITALDQANDAVKRLDNAIRETAVAEFHETGNFNLHPAVSIQRRKKVVFDESTVVEWVLEMQRDDLIIVNKKAFESAVQDGIVPHDVAKVVTEYTPAVSKKLDEYLYEGGSLVP